MRLCAASLLRCLASRWGPSRESSWDTIVTDASGVRSGGALPEAGRPDTGLSVFFEELPDSLRPMLGRAVDARPWPALEGAREKVEARFMLLAASATYAWMAVPPLMGAGLESRVTREGEVGGLGL